MDVMSDGTILENDPACFCVDMLRICLDSIQDRWRVSTRELREEAHDHSQWSIRFELQLANDEKRRKKGREVGEGFYNGRYHWKNVNTRRIKNGCTGVYPLVPRVINLSMVAQTTP